MKLKNLLEGEISKGVGIMKNDFDIAELILIKELVEEKLKEIEGSEYFKHTREILKSTLEKIENNLI